MSLSSEYLERANGTSSKIRFLAPKLPSQMTECSRLRVRERPHSKSFLNCVRQPVIRSSSYRFYTGFLSATWLPYLLAMEGQDLWQEKQAMFMGVAKLIYGATILMNPIFGLVGDQISTEARAAWNIGKEFALWLWAPDINLFKDPRWGRGQEVPGAQR